MRRKTSEKKQRDSLTGFLIAVVAAFCLAGSCVSIGPALIKNKHKTDVAHVVEAKRENRETIFANTINGTMLYIPVNEHEGIAEATGKNGQKGFYLWYQTGDMVTITDDIMVTQQKTLYDYMLALIEHCTAIRKTETAYEITVKGTENILNMMTESWGLSNGQALGALNVYEAATTDNVKMQLLVGTESDFRFEINMYVKDKAYQVYSGTTFENDIEYHFNPKLYGYNSVAGLTVDDELAQNYLYLVLDCFYSVAEISKLPDNLSKNAEEGQTVD